MAGLKIRELSHQELSDADFQEALTQLDAPDVPDLVAAVLAATLVEHALEQTLKRNFKRHDASTWGRMIDGAGPLRDFHAKIVTGFALGRFNDDVRINLNIVRDIRNAFAHSKALLRFTHPTVRAELSKSRPIKNGNRLLHSGTLALGADKRAYLELCLSLHVFFHLKLQDYLKRRERQALDQVHAEQVLRKLIAAMDARKKVPARPR